MPKFQTCLHAKTPKADSIRNRTRQEPDTSDLPAFFQAGTKTAEKNEIFRLFAYFCFFLLTSYFLLPLQLRPIKTASEIARV